MKTQKLIFLLAVLFLLVPLASHAQTHQFCPTDATCTWTGPQTFNGPVSIPGNVSVGGTLGAKCVNGVCDAANATGADWCAKATNAATALSGSVGKVTISVAAGTSVCAAALVVPSNVTLEWTQAGTWTTACAGITSTSTTNIELKGQKGVVITKPNCANFSRTFLGTSVTGASIHDIEWNGNGNNQAVGEQSPDIFFNDSSRIHIYRNYLHDAQGDNVQINSDGNSLCDDILIENNSFNNMGRDPVTLTGFGCNNFRVLANYMNLGTLVTTSTSHGNAIHLEADNSGSIMFQGVVVSDNTAINQNGVCYSMTAVTGTPILGAIVTNNACSGTNTVQALSGGVLLLQVQGATITGNSVRWTGAAAGNNCYLVEDTPGVSAQTHRTVFADNICDGATGDGIAISASEASGTAQAFDIHDNIINGTTGPGIDSEGVASDISIHHNLITNSQAQGIKVNGAARFSVDNNIIRDFGLGGGSIDGIMITCGLAIGPGLVHDNTVGSSTTTSKTGIHALCSSTGNTFFYNNFLTDNATPQTLAAGNIGGFSGQPEANAPTGIAGLDFLWADSTAHRWKMVNNNGTAQSVAGFLDNLGVFATGGTITPAIYASLTNCSSTGGTCVAAPAGAVTIAAAASTVTVATTAVTANSDIILTRNNGLGTRLSVTCNTQSSLVLGTAYVSAISAGVSFTITIDVAPTTNPLCLSYSIVN